MLSKKIIPFLCIFLITSLFTIAQTQTIREIQLDTITIKSQAKLKLYKNYKRFKKINWIFNKNSNNSIPRWDSIAFISKIPLLSEKGIIVYKISTPLTHFNDSFLSFQFLLIKVAGEDTTITKYTIGSQVIKHNKLEIDPDPFNDTWKPGTDIYLGILIKPKIFDREILYKKYYIKTNNSNIILYKAGHYYMSTISSDGFESPFTVEYLPL